MLPANGLQVEREGVEMSIKVIGTGFGRTGTDSMREALAILGFGPCHHMQEVNGNEEQKRMWRALAQGATPDWNQLLSGYVSCLDWPSAYYWRELIEFYPNARVILTYRSAESWWESFEKTIAAGLEQSVDQESLGLVLIARQVFGGRPGDRAHAIACYEANVRAVYAGVPPERLLVHALGDGWEPLCTHLGVAIPDQDYPNRNNAAGFRSRFSLN
ncbi:MULTISPECIES: sulfotransferase family protein [unclassified Mesorhizobium]|uniref:sulfotransferase family protein n=1 Tax=unclassified Mesorhizobium TaxID=325217 RepID=UPI001FEE6C76|nr:MULTISPECIES: sulfotransferase family protein [unclassified Mesorhizobium]